MPQPGIEFAADDKVLFLGIPDVAVIRGVAARLTRGVLVAIDDAERVRAARREFRDLANAMFVPGSPDEIPWQDGFFTRVIDTREGDWPNPRRVAEEMRRVGSKPRE
jgi:hypothetical protein